MNLSEIQAAIADNSLTSPRIVFERTVKACADIADVMQMGKSQSAHRADQNGRIHVAECRYSEAETLLELKHRLLAVLEPAQKGGER